MWVLNSILKVHVPALVSLDCDLTGYLQDKQSHSGVSDPW